MVEKFKDFLNHLTKIYNKHKTLSHIPSTKH